MRVRKITNNGAKKVIGKFPSFKLKKTIWWESQIERDFIYLLEFDPDVLFYKEQPFPIKYDLDGKLHRYTPDFLVERSKKRQIVEVKPEEHVAKERYIKLFRSITLILLDQGYEYLVVTDKTIRVQPRLHNIKLMIKYARIPITPHHQIICHEFFLKRDEARFSDLAQFFAAKCIEVQVIYSLLFAGILVTDLMTLINPDSCICLS